MNLTSKQQKLIELTMELDIKAKEYKLLCDELESLKKSNLDENDEKYVNLRDRFAENLREIKSINNQLKDLNKN